ncbi:MAG: helicase-related protein [Candidatus Hodarchaeota archaeon]
MEKEIKIDPFSLKGYELFIKCKRLPNYKVRGNKVFTDLISYNHIFGKKKIENIKLKNNNYLFDYQKWVINKALENKNYAAFLDCGLGKSLIELNWANSVSKLGKVIILCPLSVINELYKDNEKYSHFKLYNLRKNKKWNSGIGIINYECMRKIDMKNVIGICVDEASILKNGNGEIRKYLTDLQINCEYRLTCSATPAPNDQSEYACQAVFLNQANNLKEYYSRYFRKDGTKWIMKGHAENSFYENLNTWACYIENPIKLGFEKGGYLSQQPEYIELRCATLKKYIRRNSFFHSEISLKDFQKIAGQLRSDPEEPRFIESLKAIKNHNAIIWCIRNSEQALYKKYLKGSIVIDGQTPIEKRIEIINEFKRGNIQYLISKPKVLGFGVNLQEASAHLYSGYDFSFERFYQAVRRSHRYGRKGRLKVYIPLSSVEYPVYEILRRKLNTFEKDVLQLQNKFDIGAIK